MLTQLLESAPRRPHRQYGIFVSIAGHAPALSSAVVAAHPSTQVEEPDRVIIWHPPPPPPCAECAPPSSPGSVSQLVAPPFAFPLRTAR